MERRKTKAERKQVVYCLSMDLKGSTKVGMEKTTLELQRFNEHLVAQIKPHLQELELGDARIKFEGDGWLLMTDDVKNVTGICCLAIIMANRLQHEISERTGFGVNNIPPLRLAICCGLDTCVELPDGSKDWAGDSARRATRSAEYCYPNETLIDESIRQLVFRDFDTRPADITSRPPEYQPKKCEEDLTLHVLSRLKPQAAAQLEAPRCFVYTLSQVCTEKEVGTAAREFVKVLTTKSDRTKIMTKAQLRRNLRVWNKLMACLPDYRSRLGMLKSIQAVGLDPDVVTYNTLIAVAPGYKHVRSLLGTMLSEGIQPSVFTYNILIHRARSWKRALALLDMMRSEGIRPDVVTYNTLISKAPDNNTSKTLLSAMWSERIQPNAVTYNVFMSKAPDFDTAVVWAAEMRSEGIEPNVMTYNRLIHRAPDYEKAVVWAAEMRSKGLHPSHDCYNKLISKAPNDDSRKAWLNTMRSGGIQPDVATYNTLILKAHDYDTAAAWASEMLSKGMRPSQRCYDRLTRKAPDDETALSWAETMHHVES